MKLVALLAIRNEEKYIERCLQNLIVQGFEVILIDNDSADKSVELAEKYLNRGVKEIIRFKYNGYYEWTEILKFKEELYKKTEADWFLHCDADEIHEPPQGFDSIKSALKQVEEEGYNAINFDEFVFVPVDEKEDFSERNYVEEMKYYYYYYPSKHHRLKLWKRTSSSVDLSTMAGHQVILDNIKIYPQSFVLRHYIFLSYKYAIQKYSGRNFLPAEVETKGWHGWRANFQENILKISDKNELKILTGNNFDTSDPQTSHIFLKT